MPHATTDFSACGAGEIVTLAIGFSARLASGESLSTATCAISVYSGSDASPQSRLLAGPSISGAQVGFLFGNGVAGATYEILVVVTTSAGQTLECYAYQPVTAQ
jgi:hypothetical protein